jgi:hypothetical protein
MRDSAKKGMPVRLSDFISRDIKVILATWDSFARAQLPAADNLNTVILRDHAEEILRAVAKDLQAPQSAKDQHDKSLGSPSSSSMRGRRFPLSQRELLRAVRT